MTHPNQDSKQYILQSKPTDNRYHGTQTLYNEGTFSPIYAQESYDRYPKGRFLKLDGEYVVQWKGGPYPSRHIEIWQPLPTLPGDTWRNETLPLSYDKANEILAKRVISVSKTNDIANFEYRLIEA